MSSGISSTNTKFAFFELYHEQHYKLGTIDPQFLNWKNNISKKIDVFSNQSL